MHTLFLLLLTLCTPDPMTSHAGAQQGSPAQAAEAAVRAAFEDLEGMRWKEVAEWVHPEAVAGFRAMELEDARSAERLRVQEDALPADPNMPPEVAAYFAEQRRKYGVDTFPKISYEFAGVRSLNELEALSPLETLTRWIQARDPREMLRREIERAGRSFPARESLARKQHHQRTVLGSVVEDDSTVQVVYRAVPFGGTERSMERIAVATVRSTPEGWRLWSLWRDPDLFQEFPAWGVVVETAEGEKQRLEQAARTVVTWPAEGTPAGRAFVTEVPEDGGPPRALVIEVRGRDGSPGRIEVPRDAFGKLVELLANWPLPPD